jgi:hypothetical protein
MPFYFALKREPESVQKRAAGGLIRLKEALKKIPKRTIEETVLLATWNIREFDSGKYGARTAECFYYIAEIITHFDLVAIQEVRDDLRALDKLQEILGGWWKYIVTDVTEGTAGNRERMAFLYDSRKVTFGGLAGEVVLPDSKKERSLQFARTPFLCGFKAGWSKFNLCTVHIYYGKASAVDPRRVKEIDDLAKFLAKRAADPPKQPDRPDGKVTAVRNPEAENLVLLGDFNIFNREDVTMQSLLKAGFTVPKELQTVSGSNKDQDRHYDQIAFITRPSRFGTTGNAGVFNFYEYVFRDQDEAEYRPLMGEAKRYNDWRTYQMSDHLLMWIELKIDFAAEYLREMTDALPPAEPMEVSSGNGAARRKRQKPISKSGRHA